MLHCWRWGSSGKSVFNYNPAERRMLTPVSNFPESYQMAASTAPPCSLFSTCWVFPVKGKYAAGSSQRTLLLPASLSIYAPKSGHRFLYNLGARSLAPSVVSRSCFCLSTVSVLFFPLYTLALTTPSASIRSFQSSRTDRPSRTICSSPPADFQSLRSFPPNLPYDLHIMLPTRCSSKTSLLRASLLDARSPAVHLQRLGWLLVSATIFNRWLQLCASTCRLPPNGRTRTPHGHTGLPQSGCSHKALTTTGSHAQSQATEYWRERTTIIPRRIQHLSPVGCN